MLLAIMLSILCGFILNLMPDAVSAAVNDYILSRLSAAMTGLITAVAGPLVFLSILGSICSMGDVETLSKIGTKTIRVILLYMLIISILLTGLGSLFFRVDVGNGEAANYAQVFDLIYGIIPSNLFEPFITGNILQLIFIAVMIGLAMLILSSRVNGIFKAVDQLSSIVQTIMSGLSSILPFLIFVLLTGMISNGKLSALLVSWKIIAKILLLICVYYVINFLRIALTKKVRPSLLLKKVWPTLMIALTTASSAASFSTNTTDARRKLGIDKKLVEFGIPVGQVLFMPSFVALMLMIETSFAQTCGIPITVPWLIVGFATNLLLSFAVPPIPGSGALCFAIVFAQLGIPVEMMAIALAVDAIVDFPATAVNVSSWQLTLIDVADSLNMLNKDILRSEK